MHRAFERFHQILWVPHPRRVVVIAAKVGCQDFIIVGYSEYALALRLFTDRDPEED